ncbi:MAG: ferritin [Gemmatimonadales bacterium]|nr:ferritin [Gemmatimonadales bacterium]
MPSAAMQQKLNDQVKHEFYASFVYLSMAAWLDARNLPGMANWMRVQAGEEHAHALKIYEHLLDRGAPVVLQTIPQPPVQFTSPLEVFEYALHHEQGVTQSIHAIYRQAVEDADYASQVFLGWFVTEQVEEEKSAGLAVEQLRMAGDDRSAILLLDREFASRQPEAAGGEAAD